MSNENEINLEPKEISEDKNLTCDQEIWKGLLVKII